MNRNENKISFPTRFPHNFPDIHSNVHPHPYQHIADDELHLVFRSPAINCGNKRRLCGYRRKQNAISKHTQWYIMARGTGCTCRKAEKYHLVLRGWASDIYASGNFAFKPYVRWALWVSSLSSVVMIVLVMWASLWIHWRLMAQFSGCLFQRLCWIRSICETTL